MNQEQVAQILQTTPETIRAFLRGIEPLLHVWIPEPDEWSINQVIGHLIETDRHAFADRIQLMLDEKGPEIPGVDVNQLAAERDDNQRDASDLLDELAAQRVAHCKFVLSITADQMARTATFKKHGEFRVSDFVYEWAYHDCDHIQQILAVVKTAAWPQLSETMQGALGG